MCGCGAYGHRHELHAFQPKWCSSSPALRHVGLADQAAVALRLGIDVHDANRVGRPSFRGLRSATYASFSGGDCVAIVGDG